jgi:hypothetical protein
MLLSDVLDSNPSWKILSKSQLESIIKSQGIYVSKTEIEEHFKKSTLAQLFKRPPRSEHFRINALPKSYQIDIVKLVQYKTANKGIDQMLLIVDILSRKAFAYTLRSGSMVDVLEVYKEFVEQEKPIVGVAGDDFFSSKSFLEFNESLKIRVHTSVALVNHASSSGNKLGIVDRLVRTLKSLIEKRVVSTDDPVWTSYLGEIMDLYNSTPHQSLKLDKKQWVGEPKGLLTPNAAYTNIDFLNKLHLQYKKHNDELKRKLNNFEIGDTVRCLNDRVTLFTKEGEKYSRDIWKVKQQDGMGYLIECGDRVKKVLAREMCKVEASLEAGPSTSRVDQVIKKNALIRKVRNQENIQVATRVEKKPISNRVKPRASSGEAWWAVAGPSKVSLRDREQIKEKHKKPYWMG